MVDVIIPAYNCAETLPRTLASLVAQTSKNFMVTIIDDCSTQNIKKIVNDFKVYLRIQYIRNETNLKYPGLVRQVGLDNTKCPYVMFLDSDDMLAPRAIEIANGEMVRTKADLLLGAFFNQTDNGQWRLLGEGDTTWLHGNIYSREFLEKNNIRFPSGYNEDGGFNTQCYMLMVRSGFIKEPLYYWMSQSNSITRKESYFAIKYGYTVISTLTEGYKNVLAHNGNNGRTWNNLGNHLGLFHKLYDNLIEIGEPLKDEREKFAEELKIFFKELNVNETNPYFGEIKKGFCNGFVRYVKEEIHITPEEFFELAGYPIQFSACDFNKLGEKPQLTKEEMEALGAKFDSEGRPI